MAKKQDSHLYKMLAFANMSYVISSNYVEPAQPKDLIESLEREDQNYMKAINAGIIHSAEDGKYKTEQSSTFFSVPIIKMLFAKGYDVRMHPDKHNVFIISWEKATEVYDKEALDKSYEN